MIILKEECNNIGVSVAEFLKNCPVPAQTIRDWCKSDSKSQYVKVFLSNISLVKLLATTEHELQEMKTSFQTQKVAIANLEEHNKYLSSKLSSVKSPDTDEHNQMDFLTDTEEFVEDFDNFDDEPESGVLSDSDMFMIDRINLAIFEGSIFSVLNSKSIPINPDGTFAYSTLDNIIDVIYFYLDSYSLHIDSQPIELVRFMENERNARVS